MHEGNELETSNCSERHNEPRINIVQHRDICWCNDSRGSMFSATTVAYYGTLLPIIPDGSKGSVIHGLKTPENRTLSWVQTMGVNRFSTSTPCATMPRWCKRFVWLRGTAKNFTIHYGPAYLVPLLAQTFVGEVYANWQVLSQITPHSTMVGAVTGPTDPCTKLKWPLLIPKNLRASICI
jgi:hypothetical protein